MISLSSDDPGAPLSGQTSPWCLAFISDADGRVILDFGEQLSCFKGPISAASLVSMIEPASLKDFLETVRTNGGKRGWERRSHDGSALGSLQLHGSHTSSGILVLATWRPGPLSLRLEYPQPAAEVQAPSHPGSGQPGAAPGSASLLKLEQDDAAELLSAAIHGLDNKISSIIGSCEFLTAYSPENLIPEQLEMITLIESSARDLLEISRTIHTQSRLRPEFASRGAAPPAETANPAGV